MRYPMLTNYCDIFYDENGDPFLRYYPSDQDIPLNPDAVEFLSALDGKTDPYTIWPEMPREDVDEILDLLNRDHLLRHSRVLQTSLGSIQWTVWIPHLKSERHILANIFNIFIMLWPLWLAVGCFGFWHSMPLHDFPLVPIWGIAGLFLGLPLHELGHMCACLSYGGKVFELGMGLHWFFPMGYVIQEQKYISSPLKRAQVDAAGVEVNMAFAGFLLLLAYFLPRLNQPLLWAAIYNILGGLLNLVFCNGLDGFHILGDLLGFTYLNEIVDAVVSRRSARKGLLRYGPTGYAVISACYILKFLYLSFPLVVLEGLLEVVL